MISEEGFVERTEGSKAVIRVQRNSACAQCESQGMCKDMADKTMLLQLENVVGAKHGDRVEISVPSGAVAKASLLLYMIPAIALIVGAYAGSIMAEWLGVSATPGSIAGGLGAMAGSFYLIARAERGRGARDGINPRITRILPQQGLLNKPDEPRERAEDLIPPP